MRRAKGPSHMQGELEGGSAAPVVAASCSSILSFAEAGKRGPEGNKEHPKPGFLNHCQALPLRGARII